MWGRSALVEQDGNAIKGNTMNFKKTLTMALVGGASVLAIQAVMAEVMPKKPASSSTQSTSNRGPVSDTTGISGTPSNDNIAPAAGTSAAADTSKSPNSRPNYDASGGTRVRDNTRPGGV
jgi:hypothetical protein